MDLFAAGIVAGVTIGLLLEWVAVHALAAYLVRHGW